MYIFIWKQVDYATEEYHPEGGIVVFAQDPDAAAGLIRATCPGKCEALTSNPDICYKVPDAEENIIVFPNAGCC